MNKKAFAILIFAFGSLCCRGKKSEGSGLARVPDTAAEIFRDEAESAGLDFHHFNGATGDFYLPEIMGSGVALVDYDGDGDLDVFFTQSTFLDKTKSFAQSLYPTPAGWKPGNRLFRNELVPSGTLRFTDVTAQAGVGVEFYGRGVISGDYNNDGYPDLYVTGLGRNILYRNNGNGTFTDVTRYAGAEDRNWSASAAFCDYDQDGFLDLIVSHYVAFKENPVCVRAEGEREYCGPKSFGSSSSRLLHNLRNGRFQDVSFKAGIENANSAGLGVSCADFNRDGKLDFYIANDQRPNNLWQNNGDGTFKDVALSTGTGYSADGRAQSGMGVTAGDFSNRGVEDIFVTNLMGEANSLFCNDGHGFFEELSMKFGLATPSLVYTGFGTGFFDYDNDGYLVLFVANGAVSTNDTLRATVNPYLQKNRRYHNAQGAKFEDVSDSAGPAMRLSGVGRSAVFGDLNNDGAVDVVVTNNSGPVRMLMTATGTRAII